MNKHLWRRVGLFSLVIGLTLVISPYLAMFAATFIGIYIAGVWWFTDYPAQWWYDFAYFAVLLGLAVVGALISVAICVFLPYVGMSTYACQSLTLGQRVALSGWVLMFIGALFWLWHVWIVWRIRRN